MSQKEDKQRIYNSRDWKRLRADMLAKKPLCERCLKRGKWVEARLVHHIIPIETATDWEHMKELAFKPDNLMSLCFECHSDIHKELNSRTKEGHQKAVGCAIERWLDKHRK